MIRQGWGHYKIHRPLFKNRLYKEIKKASHEEMCNRFNYVIKLTDLEELSEIFLRNKSEGRIKWSSFIDWYDKFEELGHKII